jgi:Ferritin-like
MVEFTTIPPYLTAMYSIADPTSQVYGLIRGVVLEEMLHLNLVANLLNAIGGTPRLVGELPQYPCYLPHQRPGGPFIQLMPLSTALVSEVFMEIEQPVPVTARAQSGPYSTVGQLYAAIEEGFENCVRRYGADEVFQDTGFQRTTWDYGYSGGVAIAVTDLGTAKLAIKEIVEQGEGAETVIDSSVPTDPWSTYERYGLRTDGTYGPILGTPEEVSHYYTFQAIANGRVPMPPTYPMAANPSAAAFTDPLVREVAEIFNGCYGLLARALQGALGTAAGDELFFGVVVPMMHSALPALAPQLMRMPLSSESDAVVGPTAGPPWEYSGQSACQLLARTNALISSLSQAAAGDAALASLVAALTTVATTLADVTDRADVTAT